MKREEVLSSPEYWTAKVQVSLFDLVWDYMNKYGMNEEQLEKHLLKHSGISKKDVSQLLNGNIDCTTSKFFELTLALGFVPKINFIPIEDYIQQDSLT